MNLTVEELDILMDCLDVCSSHYDESYDDTDEEKINFNTLYEKVEQLQNDVMEQMLKNKVN
jgi:hypothetical protein